MSRGVIWCCWGIPDSRRSISRRVPTSPRQKIYQVLGGDKGFASVAQDHTKLFSAVRPSVAIPAYLARERQLLEHELTDQARSANGLLEDLSDLYSEGKSGRGTLDFL